ncbi:hypothetical protein B0H14DRAFT_3427609 [Mycena olivaceomarginata]|nr:hypothetical protein B0H14DRAFT_3427609 [Mycena olivaceomarginata]
MTCLGLGLFHLDVVSPSFGSLIPAQLDDVVTKLPSHLGLPNNRLSRYRHSSLPILRLLPSVSAGWAIDEIEAADGFGDDGGVNRPLKRMTVILTPWNGV